jgi:hypothetical protein
MSLYTVMEPEAGDRDGRAERALLLRDGFSFVAFLLPAPWLLFHRLWIEALLAIAVTLAIAALGSLAGFGSAAPLLSLLVSLYVGLEATTLRMAALRRRGWRDWGVVEARDHGEAELRFAAAVENGAEDAPHAPVPQAIAPRSALPGPALGLFSYPGSR